MIYASTQNEYIKKIKKLNTKKYRDETGFFLVEGEHLVLEAYKSGRLEKLVLLENDSFDLNVPKIYLTSNVMKFISELETPPTIMGICKKSADTLEYGDKVLILDNIQDPGNLGTIIRSAVAFNVNTLILGNDCVDLYNSKVVRSSQGMLFKINIARKNLIDVIPDLKQKNYKIFSTNVKNGKSLKNVEKPSKSAIIMGNEGLGVKDEISSLADEYLYIDMNANCESLNVAVATSIILYELDK